MDTDNAIETITLKLESWWNSLIAHLPNFGFAILVFVLIYFLGKTLRNLINKYMRRAGTDKTISAFVSQLAFVIILVLGLMFALSILDLSKTVTSLLAGLGIVGLALGFAFQDTAANFMSGIYITFRQPYSLGDVIETPGGYMGYVEHINLRVTKIRTFDGPIAYVPNRFLFQESFVNYTELGKRRIRLDCGVSYGDDLDKVERIAIQSVEDLPDRLKSEEVTVHWKEFGNSSINFSLNIWFVYNKDERKFIEVRNKAIKRLKKAFDDNDIMIPFPIRTIDFGIKGGVKLNEEVRELNLTALRSENGK